MFFHSCCKVTAAPRGHNNLSTSVPDSTRCDKSQSKRSSLAFQENPWARGRCPPPAPRRTPRRPPPRCPPLVGTLLRRGCVELVCRRGRGTVYPSGCGWGGTRARRSWAVFDIPRRAQGGCRTLGGRGVYEDVNTACVFSTRHRAWWVVCS